MHGAFNVVRMKYIIGVVGENGAGKDTFTTFFKAAAAPLVIAKHRFSDVLYETLNLWGIDTTRANLQDLAIVMDGKFGDGSVTRAAKSKIQKENADIIVLEGIRWKTDTAMIKGFDGSYIVYVTAKPKIRYERLKKRGDKVGEKETSFEQFEREEKAATELEIPQIGASADFKIVNNGTLDDFRKSVEKFAGEFIK